MKKPLLTCLLISVLFHILPFAFGQNTSRQLALIDLNKGENRSYIARDRSITKILFEAAKAGEIDIYETNYAGITLNFKKLQKNYLDKFQELYPEQLSILGIDYISDEKAKSIAIQFLHLYVAGEYFSDNIPQKVVSFRYADAKAYLDQDHRTLWIEEDDALVQNLALFDESVQAYLAKKLSQKIYKNEITAYSAEDLVTPLSNEWLSARWKNLGKIRTGDVRVQVLEDSYPPEKGLKYSSFQSNMFVFWKPLDKSMIPIAAFKMEDIEAVFPKIFGQNKTFWKYTDALEQKKFKTKEVIWQAKVDNDKDIKPSSFQALREISYYTRSEIDLQEDAHSSLQKEGSEIAKILLKAVEKGKLETFDTEFVASRGNFVETEITWQQVKKNLIVPKEAAKPSKILGISEEQVNIGLTPEQIRALDEYDHTEKSKVASAKNLYKNPSTLFYKMDDISLLEIEYELVYDTQKNTYSYHSAYLSLYVPASKTISGVNKLIAKFRFQDAYRFLKRSPKMKLLPYQRMAFEKATGKSKSKLKYHHIWCKQLYIGNRWMVEGVYW